MKKINWFLNLMMIIGTLWIAITNYDSSRLLTYLAVIPVLFAPCILNKTAYKLNENEKFIYYLFIFFADFLGCVVNLYNMIWWYDIFMHFCSGIFTFSIGIFILKRMKVSTSSKFFVILFSLGIVMLIAGIWEFFEYGADQILKMDLQHNLSTGVGDTMEDMLAAFFGGILSSIPIFLKRN